jgi:RNA recognition motif-containing protein
MKLFVVGFDNSVTLVDLLMLFQEFGDVEAIRMKQGEKRRYALIEMGAYGGERAIAELDGKNWRGMRLEVTESRY